MLFVDSLAVIGIATISLGTIQETDGAQERTFWLRNAGDESVVLLQGYTSCGCTTIVFDKDSTSLLATALPSRCILIRVAKVEISRRWAHFYMEAK